MQGPLGSTACAQLPGIQSYKAGLASFRFTGTLVSLSLKWNTKLLPILAFDGGIGPIIREIFDEMGELTHFYEIVRENIAIFQSSNNIIGEHNIFLPTAELTDKTERFKACSVQVYAHNGKVTVPVPTSDGINHKLHAKHFCNF
jgi:hypothetical protein